MWTQNIIEIEKNKDTFNFVVDFFKDGEWHSNKRFNNVSDPESVHQLIRGQLAQLKKIDELALAPGPIDVSVPVPEPAPALTPEELAAKEKAELYMASKMKLMTAKQEVELGLKTQAEYDALLTKAQTDIAAVEVAIVK